MAVQVKVPEVGESITEGVLVEWLKKEGEEVQGDEPLFVLETDKITMTVNAPGAGHLKIQVSAGETVRIGQVVGSIEETRVEGPVLEEKRAPEAPTEEGLAPSVRRLVEEHGLDPSRIRGTGKGGRLTKEDIIKHLEEKAPPEAAQKPPPEREGPSGEEETSVERTVVAERKGTEGRQTRTKISPFRQRVGQRLVEAQRGTATLTTFNEADMSSLLELRGQHQERFQQRHQVKLGIMSFFVKATVDALRAWPQFASQLEGDEIVQSHYYDIGIAVSSDRGLVVPVLRDADGLSFAGIERGIKELAKKAQDRTLTLEDLTGGVFSISNGGIYGNLLSTPILNPPQCGILGMHAIKRRPVVEGDTIVIRPMMYLALSYDHRLVDGREAVSFLKRIIECVENPERLMLEI